VSDTLKRVLAVLPLIPLILWLMFAGPVWGFQCLVLGAVTIAGFELGKMIAPEDRLLQVIVAVGTLGFSAARVLSTDAAVLDGAIFGVAMLALVGGLLRPDPVDQAAVRIGFMFGAPIYAGFLLSSIALLHAFPSGGSWVLLSMFVAWLSDTFAYFGGKFFGKNKLYPKLSPKKTIEGAASGLVGSVLGAVSVSLFLIPDQLPVAHAVVLGLFGGALGQAGDLFESLLKRSVGVKDSGQLLPGHGGILDRVDALMFTSSGIWVYAHFILGVARA
jgi:phosphatidate cytidylyltransferase